MIVATAPASAGPLSLAGPLLVKSDSQVEQIRYRHRHYEASPGAIIGGMLGVVGGLAGGGGRGFSHGGGGHGGGGHGGGHR
jgi:hypothetical protein